jgi:cell division protein ZapA (FtsZ GTPase activity inhibitor)
MENNDILEIPVTIAGRTYPVLASPDEVAGIESIKKQLSAEFSDLKARYSNKLNNQDILAMLLLTYAKNLQEERVKHNNTAVAQKVASIEQLLEHISLK